MGIRGIVGPVPMIIRTIMDIPLHRFLCRRAGDSLNNLLRIIEDSTIGKYTFLRLMRDGFGISPHTFCLAYVCSPIYLDLRQLGFWRHICRGYCSPGDLRYLGYHQKVGRDTMRFAYQRFQKDYSCRVHGALSSSQGLLRQACTLTLIANSCKKLQ